MTAIDRQLMTRLLQQIELIANRRGWDEPAGLYVLYDWHDQPTEHAYRGMLPRDAGDAIRCGPYAARQMVRPEVLHSDGQPHHNLFRMALNLAHNDDPAIARFVQALGPPGFLGIAFVHEAWERTYRDKDREAEGDVRFADMPGSIEIRFVMAADVSGDSHLIRRRRGDKPAVLDVSGDAGSGAVIESLRAITARVAGLPVPEIVNVPVGWQWPAEAANKGTDQR